MITVDEARKQILSGIQPLGPERVDLLSALGRVLHKDIEATHAIPSYDNSAMDGYALRATDTLPASANHPIILQVTETISAGNLARHPIGPGQAARIMTGAPIPEGADAVIRFEDTQTAGDTVSLSAPVQKGQDIRWTGEDVRPGDKVLPAGTEIRPAEIGMLASLGKSFIDVYQRPVVAVLATGNELVDIDDVPAPGQIHNSNGYALAAQVRECGAISVIIGIAKDTEEDLLEKFSAAARADVILSSGGVSVGDFDLVKNILQGNGNAMTFWRVAMRPGRPLAFGAIQGKPAFGLPGNPVSSMISFEQFVRPALLKMMGHHTLYRRSVTAIVKENIRKKAGLRYFVRVSLREENGVLTASTTGDQGSAILKSMVLADGLIELPEDLPEYRSGDTVTVRLLR